jgi:signal transduction histidine kinase
LLTVGVAASAYLALQGEREQSFAQKFGQAVSPATQFMAADQMERRLTIQYLLDPQQHRSAMDAQRVQTDQAANLLKSTWLPLKNNAPPSFRHTVDQTEQSLATLPSLRKRVDTGRISVQATFSAFTALLDVFHTSFEGFGATSATAEIGSQHLIAADLFLVADWRSQSDALAMAAFSPTGLTDRGFQQYLARVGGFHSLLDATLPRLSDEQQNEFQDLMASTAWQRLMEVERAVEQIAAVGQGEMSSSQSAGTLPISQRNWDAASSEVSGRMIGLFVEQATHSSELAAAHARSQLWRSLFTGIALILLALAVFSLVTRMSTGLIRRLLRLRRETLDVAHVRLPVMVERLRNGEPVDVERELPPLRYGKDEIGQVADAFNQAQKTAVTAAIKEAETLAGTSKVFLNIAHRSQIIVHRQLKVLDQAERTQADSEQLDLLFQLDHLATRARRNAENLIVLGGGQAGRRWLNPVPLLQVVRSAIGEAERYTRVSTGQLPRISMSGAVVSDLIHLLAELIDNATTFSPPSTRVEVRGNLVGRGVVIEIEDQGLGMDPMQLKELNSLLQDPPDFGVMALSEEPRLGLFVVAQLAARHGVQVSLAHSPSYGGTRAIVLVPSALIASATAATTAATTVQPEIAPRLGADSSPGFASPARMSLEAELAGLEAGRARLRPVRAGLETGSAGLEAGHAGSTGPPTNPTPVEPLRTIPRATGEPTTVPRPDEAKTPPQRRGQRPPLPQRTRQTHLAPQLLREMGRDPEPQGPEVGPPSAERARDRLAALQRGTQQGRTGKPEDHPVAPGVPAESGENGTSGMVGETGRATEHSPRSDKSIGRDGDLDGEGNATPEK